MGDIGNMTMIPLVVLSVIFAGVLLSEFFKWRAEKRDNPVKSYGRERGAD